MCCRANIVNYLMMATVAAPKVMVSHCYFATSGATRMVTVVSDLVRQLLVHCTRIPWLVDNVYDKLRPDAMPSLKLSLAMFASFAELYETIWVVIDGLNIDRPDSLSTSELKTTLDALRNTKS